MIELLVVATIIIVLTTIGIISYRQAGISSRDGKRKTDLQVLRQALMLYKADNGCFPEGTSYSNMLTEISDYLADSDINISDPTDETPHVYSYAGTGTQTCDDASDGALDFTLQAVLEKDDSTYSLTSP